LETETKEEEMTKRVITDTERFNFLCDCEDEGALNLLSEQLGDRGGLTKWVDALIEELGEAE
jgi:hypothetical protein